MTNKQIIIDGVDIKDCKRRIGKDNFCRYYKRPCAENNYNCIWKKYLRKEQECEEFKQALAEIKEIVRQETVCDDCNFQGTDKCDSRVCTSFYLDDFCKSLLQKISECEEENEHS